MKCSLCDKDFELTEAQVEALERFLVEDSDLEVLCDACGARVAADAKERPQ